MYDYIISQMVWSFSRLSAFNECPYRFFLRYICAEDSKTPMFFSEYGSFVHGILCDFYSGKISQQDALSKYLLGFQSHVTGKAPSPEIFSTYFQQGMAFMRSIQPFDDAVLCTERSVRFDVEGLPFVGVIDMVCMDASGALCIVDHKSRALKARTHRKKPTKSDEELDRYLRQLYLYAIAVRDMCGEYPEKLMFNCFRTGELIAEPFREEGLLEAKRWAVDSVNAIKACKKWKPCPDYFRCRHLCEMRTSCEYYQMMGGGHY